MKAARCLWAVGLLLAGMTPRLAIGQSSADSAVRAASATSNVDAAESATGASPWGWIKMPKVTMPKVTMPKMPADPLAPVKSSARKVSDGAKKAWEGTKEIFTFGGDKKTAATSTGVPSHNEEPSFWSKMFGGAEEPQPPQTVADFMAQKRVE
jgi:hypothetical protein